MNSKPRFLLCVLVVSLALSGCLGSNEIDDLALVMAVGVDKGKEPGSVRLSVQIARPSDARGQTGAPAGGTGKPIWTASSEGKSLFEAIRNLARFTSRRVFWAHNQIVVIGEDLARSGINDVIDFFSRNPQLRMRTWFVVTSGQASEVIATKTGLEVIPGISLNKLFRYSGIVAEAPQSDLRSFLAAYRSESSQPVMARMNLKRREVAEDKPAEFGSISQVELSGAAVFKGDKMVGWLTPKESRAMLWFTEHLGSGIYVLPCPDNETKVVSLELKDYDFEVIPIYQNNQVKFRIRLTAYMELVEFGCDTSVDHEPVPKWLEKVMVKHFHEEFGGVTDKMQNKYHADFLELGKTFQNRYPLEWQSLKTNWVERLSQAEFVFDITTHVNTPATLRNPLIPGKKE